MRLHDGLAVREIHLEQLTRPVIEVELHGEAKIGDRLVVVVEPAPGKPALATYARILGSSSKGPSWYHLGLDKAMFRACIAES